MGLRTPSQILATFLRILRSKNAYCMILRQLANTDGAVLAVILESGPGRSDRVRFEAGRADPGSDRAGGAAHDVHQLAGRPGAPPRRPLPVGASL